MKDVSYDNYGAGYSWHGTVGKQRQAYKTARKIACKKWGRAAVEFVEQLCRCDDEHVIRYVLEKRGLDNMVSLSVGGEGYLCDILLRTAKLRAERWQAYEQACKKLDITRYPNLPPNWSLVIMAANDGPAKERSIESLNKVGQFGGRFGSLKEEEAKKIKLNYKKLMFELHDKS